MFNYYTLYKPFNMLSQFTREGEKAGWGELGLELPKDVYAIGRLDADSEGLLLLSNDKAVNDLLLHPRHQHPRKYLVQVEGIPDSESLQELEAGPEIAVDGKKYKTLACTARLIDEPAGLPERNPPVRFRKSVPTSWLEIQLVEGKNRQVRKMTAAVGFPTLRLIRIAIGKLELGALQPGEVREIGRPHFYQKLGLRP